MAHPPAKPLWDSCREFSRPRGKSDGLSGAERLLSGKHVRSPTCSFKLATNRFRTHRSRAGCIKLCGKVLNESTALSCVMGWLSYHSVGSDTPVLLGQS